MAVQFDSTIKEGIGFINIRIKPLKYYMCYVDMEYTNATDSDVIFEFSTEDAAGFPTRQINSDMWFESSGSHFNWRCYSRDGTQSSRFNVGDWNNTGTHRTASFVTQDMSDIDIWPTAWQDGSKYTVSEYTPLPGSYEGWTTEIISGSTNNIVHLGSWPGSAGTAGDAYNLKLYHLAFWYSDTPFGDGLITSLFNKKINPMSIPGCFFYSDFKMSKGPELITKQYGIDVSSTSSLPTKVSYNGAAQFPSLNSLPVHMLLEGITGHEGHLLPDELLQLKNLFGDLVDIDDIDIDPGDDDGNWLTVTEPALIDTFTDTNSTQIDNHTPELVFSVDGWIKNGATSYPQIQSNKLVFNSTGQNETAELDLGLLGTTAFSKPYIISGEATWLSPGGGVVTFEIGEKPFWTGYYINNTGWLFELDDDVSAIELSTRISQVENVVSTYSGYDFTANNGVHSFEVKVYPTGLVEGRAWPSNGTRPDAAMVSYDYSVHSEIYTMTSREFTIATWINQNFEVNNLNIEDSFIPESNTNTANTLGGTAALFPIAGSWVNASNALVDNEADASWTGALNTPFTTTFLRLTNFGFSLPADASVAGVEISMRKLGSQMKSITARLTGFSGTEFGTQIEFIDEPTDPNVATIGGIGYDWGVNLTKAFVESIGIDIQGVSNDSVSGTAAIQIEVVWLKIYYYSKRDF